MQAIAWLGVGVLVSLAVACGGDEEADTTPEQGVSTQSTDPVDCETTASGSVCCGVIPGPDSQTATFGGCDAGETINFGGIYGNLDAPMPPLPSGLVAVSDYIEFEFEDEGAPNIAGFVLPLTEDITDRSTIAFYTYEQDAWRRAAEGTAIRDGRAEGEFTAVPSNLAVLKATR